MLRKSPWLAILWTALALGAVVTSPALAGGGPTSHKAMTSVYRSQRLDFRVQVPPGFTTKIESARSDASPDQIAESVLFWKAGVVAMRLDVFKDGVPETAQAWFDRTHRFLLNPESRLASAQVTPRRVPAVRLTQAQSSQAYAHELLFWVDGPLKFRWTWYDTDDKPARPAFDLVAATCSVGGER
jgi:hypothetical protein